MSKANRTTNHPSPTTALEETRSKGRRKAMSARRRLVTLLATVAAGMAAIVLPTAPAAAEDDSSTCLHFWEEAYACFTPYGDVFELWDLKSDGRTPEIYWATDYGREGHCLIPTGRAYSECNLNLAEGRTVHFFLNMYRVSDGRFLHYMSGSATI